MSSAKKIDRDIYKMIVENLAGADDSETMGANVTQLLVGALEVKGATIFVLNPETDELETLSSSGLSPNFINKGPILVDKSIRLPPNRKPVIIRDTAADKRLQYPEKAEEEGIRSIVSVPIRLRGKIIGALRIYHSDVWDVSQKELAFFEVLALNIGMALMYFRLATAVQAVKNTVDEIHPVWI
ncbi:MAG: GAF domain-containing protein [Desulfococcaceae bacterium]